MIKKYFILLFLLFSILNAFASIEDSLKFHFEEGNKMYQNGEFEIAIEKYQIVLHKGFECGEIFFNLGNAYFKINDIGNSILYFEKAKKYLSRDDDLEANLSFLRTKIIDKIEVLPQPFFVKYWNILLNVFSINFLSTSLIVGLLIINILLIIKYFSKFDLKFINDFIAICVILLCFNASLFYLKIKEEKTQVYGIIISNSSNVKNSPNENSPTSFIIHNGLKVRILRDFDNWFEVELEDGKIGWIKKTVLEVI